MHLDIKSNLKLIKKKLPSSNNLCYKGYFQGKGLSRTRLKISSKLILMQKILLLFKNIQCSTSGLPFQEHITKEIMIPIPISIPTIFSSEIVFSHQLQSNKINQNSTSEILRVILKLGKLFLISKDYLRILFSIITSVSITESILFRIFSTGFAAAAKTSKILLTNIYLITSII